MFNDQEKFFYSESQLVDFVIIEEGLEQLFQYASEIIEFTKDRRDSLLKEKNVLKDISRDEEGFCEGSFDTYFCNEELNWDENLNFIGPSILLLSLYVFVEKSLKNLCYSFTDGSRSTTIPKGTRFKVKTISGKSIIESSMLYLIDTKKFQFDIPLHLNEELEKIRILRNDFAHGDWENVRENIKTFQISNTFKNAGELFKNIERGMIVES